MGGDLVGPNGKLNPAALDLRGAQPLLLCVVERDGSMTWLAPDTMSDKNLASLKASFFQWLGEYKARRHGKGRIQL